MNENINDNAYKNSGDAQVGASFWKGFQRFILFIVITTVAFTALAAVYAALRVKTVYTAKEDFMIVITVDSNGKEVNNASLNKKLMTDIKTIMLTSGTAELANEKYYDALASDLLNGSADDAKELANKYIEVFGGISSSNLSFTFTEESLIAKITYSDINKKFGDKKQYEANESLDTTYESFNETYVAAKKLQAYMAAAEELLPSGKLPVNVVKFIDLQNRAAISESNSFWKYVLIGFAAGFVLSFAAAVVMKALDSSVRMKEELESICGTPLLACIEDVSD